MVAVFSFIVPFLRLKSKKNYVIIENFTSTKGWRLSCFLTCLRLNKNSRKTYEICVIYAY